MRSQSPKHLWQGWQLGNWPEKPLAHWSQRTPDTPCWQTQWPVMRLHWEVSMPRQSQSQAWKVKKNKKKTNNTKHRDNLNTLSSVYHQLGMAEEFIHHLLSDFFLTSTLCPGVSPEVFLTVRAGLSSKSITTLALTGKLRDRTYDENNFESDTAVCDVNLLIWFRSRCFVPHYTRRWQSCGGHSHKIHSPSHWPGSSGWGHSGRRSDPRHLADTGTVPWPVGKHSPNDLCTDSVQFPGSYRCTLSKS